MIYHRQSSYTYMFNTRYAILKFSPYILKKSSLLLYFPFSQHVRLFTHSQSPNAGEFSGFDNIYDAVASFNIMLDMHPSPSIVEFGKVLGAIVKMNSYPTAISLCMKMELSGIKPSLISLSMLINCYCHLGQMAFAFSVLGKIFKSGYEPSIITLTTLIKGLCINGQVDIALELHDCLVAQGFQFDEVTYCTLSNELCKIGRTSVAIALLRKLEGQVVKPNVGMYNTVINGLCEDGYVTEARTVFHRVVERDLVPDVISYTSLINGYFKIKRVDEAMVLFREMHHRNLVPDTIAYTSLIDGLCKAGRISYVWELVDEMQDRNQPPNIVTYSVLLDFLCKNQHLDKAITLFQKIIDLGIQPDICAYTILIDCLCKCGRLKTARQIFQHLFNEGFPLDVQIYTAMINGLCKEGFVDEAMALCLKMEDNECLPDAVTFKIIIRALLDKNENVKAEKLLNEMLAREKVDNAMANCCQGATSEDFYSGNQGSAGSLPRSFCKPPMHLLIKLVKNLPLTRSNCGKDVRHFQFEIVSQAIEFDIGDDVMSLKVSLVKIQLHLQLMLSHDVVIWTMIHSSLSVISFVFNYIVVLLPLPSTKFTLCCSMFTDINLVEKYIFH